jgi:hypothetical protein
MNRLSKLLQPISECIGGILFELACLFARRKMEQENAELEAERQRQFLELELNYKDQIRELKGSRDSHINLLTDLLKDSITERQRLQDRLLQKNASLPIFETAREQSSEPVQTQARDRAQRVEERTKSAIENQRKAIGEDVDKFLAENKEVTANV